MATTIRLLGAPAILRDDTPLPSPRGRKAWALLAYLVLSEQPAGRRRLAELLFGDAADPLGTLRWNLAQLRRSLEGIASIEGDPVRLVVEPGVEIDVRRSEEAGGELLGGLEFEASPAFESWLRVERGHFAGQAAAVLHQRALADLAEGRADEAAAIAARLVELDPFEETHHELLVRALAARDDRPGALAQVAACRRLFLRELGREPSPAVRRAADPAVNRAPGGGDRAAARALLEAGEAALAAGAVEHGLSTLRDACAEAAGCGDDVIRARALAALGSALVHAIRGRDEEGAAVLAEAVAAAEHAADRETLATALRELAFADLLAGRRASVEQRLTRASQLAGTDAEHAAIFAVQGVNRLDMGDYPGGLDALRRSVDSAARGGERRRQAYSLSFIARARLQRGELDAAADVLEQALELVDAERWIAFLPFPLALRGEIDLRAGDLTSAAERFEHSFALACKVEDPCWEGFAARNLGLLDAARGDGKASLDWLDEARSRCTRLPDRYVWMQGHVLDTSIQLALDEGDGQQARRLIRTLSALAARTEMREFVVRGLVHAARSGDDGAIDSARMIAGEIDNPTLTALLANDS